MSGYEIAGAIRDFTKELSASREQRERERGTPIERAYKILVEQYQEDPVFVVRAAKVLERGRNVDLFLAAQGELRNSILEQLMNELDT
jgi:predicted RNase H-like nuclease